MRIALVHDFLTKKGGAENVLLAMHEAFPDAPIYTLLYDKVGTKNLFEKDCEIRASSLQKYPSFIRRRPKFLFGQFPKAIEEFNFSDFDIVVSSSNAFAHGIITSPSTLHICYCHSPMRYVWDWHAEYLKENNIGFGIKGLIVRNMIHNIRIWDKLTSSRVDLWLANAKNVQNRITKYYQKDSTVLYPPVETAKISQYERKAEDFYLIVSRIEPYKKVDLAVDAFNQNGKKLIVVGEGSQLESLKKIAKENISLLGWQSNESIYKLLSTAKGLIFPGEDDFGITPVEAMAAGTPVIAFAKGGTLETVVADKTGLFFQEESVASLNHTIELFEKNIDKFTAKNCKEQSQKFSKEIFIKNLKEIVEEEYKKFHDTMEKL